MAKKLKYLFPALFISFCCPNLFAQDKSSLLEFLKTDKDTVKVNHLNALALELMNSDPDTAIILGTQQIEIISDLYDVPGDELEEEIKTNKSVQAQNLKRLLTRAYNTIGVGYRSKADFPNAFLYLKKGLSFAEELNDKNSISKFLGNLGVCFRLKGDYPKALDYLLKALKIDEEQKNKTGIAIRLGSIGSVYWNQGDYEKALNYYLKALRMNEELGDQKGIATNLGNMGSVFIQQSELAKDDPAQKSKLFDQGLEYYFKALKKAEEVGSLQLQSTTMGNIGSVYKDKGDFKGALTYLLKALKLAHELNDKGTIAYQVGSIGILFTEAPSLPSPAGETKTGYALAAKYLQYALAISDSVGLRDNSKIWCEQLSKLYKKTNVPLPDTAGNKLLTLEHTHLRAEYYNYCFIALRDTLFSEAKKKEFKNREMDFEIAKKEEEEKLEAEKKLRKTGSSKKNKLILVGLGAVSIAGIFIYRRRKKTKW